MDDILDEEPSEGWEEDVDGIAWHINLIEIRFG